MSGKQGEIVLAVIEHRMRRVVGEGRHDGDNVCGTTGFAVSTCREVPEYGSTETTHNLGRWFQKCVVLMYVDVRWYVVEERFL